MEVVDYHLAALLPLQFFLFDGMLGTYASQILVAQFVEVVFKWLEFCCVYRTLVVGPRNRCAGGRPYVSF
jgi:hypothetical protein